MCLNRRGDLCFSDADAAAKSLQSCPTLCDPIDGSPPGSAVPGILQARILEWVAISISNACMLVSDKGYICKLMRVHTLGDLKDHKDSVVLILELENV